MAIAQLQRVAWVRDGLMGFADDDAIDAYPPRQNPLFGAVFRRVRMRPQQPIQQGDDDAASGLWHGEDYGPKARFIPAWANGPGHRHTHTHHARNGAIHPCGIVRDGLMNGALR